jgi:methyl-accepting chemotaxis protein
MLLICVFLLAGCATIPKQSAMLSEELSGMIKSARISHLALLDEYLSERRSRVDEFMKTTWIPKFMDKLTKNSGVMDDLNQATDNDKKRQIMNEFQEDASNSIAERRISLVDAVNDIGEQIRNKIEEHYDQMQIVNQALTAHLRSAEQVNTTRDELLKSINVPIKEMIPFDKINQGLDKITAFEGKGEELNAKINELKSILK